MANHRTVLELKPYEGCKIERLTVDGKRSYTAYEQRTGYKKCEANSLKDLKKKIDQIRDEEHKIGNFIGRRLGLKVQ